MQQWRWSLKWCLSTHSNTLRFPSSPRAAGARSRLLQTNNERTAWISTRREALTEAGHEVKEGRHDDRGRVDWAETPATNGEERDPDHDDRAPEKAPAAVLAARSRDAAPKAAEVVLPRPRRFVEWSHYAEI